VPDGDADEQADQDLDAQVLEQLGRRLGCGVCPAGAAP
jgi:hypothetical protein